MTRSELASHVDRLQARAARAVSGPAEVFGMRSESGSVRVEKNHVSGVETDRSVGFGLRVVVDRRVGFAHFSRPDQLDAAIDQARGAARLGRALPAFRFAASGRAPRVSGLYDARLADWSGPDAISFAADLVRSARDAAPKATVTEAGVSFGSTEVSVTSSEGAQRHAQETSMSASVFVVQRETGVSTGFAGRDSTRGDLRAAELGREAADLCLRARNPTKLDPGGVRPVVLRPEPGADLLSTITLHALVGRSAHRDESYYSGKLGKRVAHAKLSILDDPLAARGLGSSPFDDEGEPSQAVPLVRHGVLRSYSYDRATAAEFQGPVTASSLRVHPFDGRSHKSPPSAAPRNVRLEGPSRPTQKIVAGVDDGLLVHDLMGVHTANTVSGDFSVTSSVLFRIRKGAIEGPVAPVSISGNLHRELERGLGLGDDVKAMAGETAVMMPSSLWEGFTVTP